MSLAIASRAAIAAALLGLPLVASAQDGITEELIRLLIKHNALPREEAEGLIKKLQQQTAAATPPAAPSTGKSGDVRVVYVPEAEKQRMQAEIQENLLQTVKAENWARPDAYPEWLGRISFEGDVRMRYELDAFDDGNSPFFIDYQEINSGSPYDVNSTNQELPPLLNTTEDRNMMRARARFGLKAQVSDTLIAGLSFTTGNTTNPVSTNQTLGSDFNKVTFVIDRAYLNFQPGADWSLSVGRMPSPWLATELIWDDDLNFDGLALQFRHQGEVLTPFATVGAFPVENTAFDFPSTNVVKESSRDKWLYGAQLGAGLKIADETRLSLGVAYYYFDNVEGQLSSLCPAFTSSVACDSDISRPAFLQKGNTLFALRDLAADPNNPNGPQYQYFGFASPFHILDVTTKLDMAVTGSLRLRFDAAYVVNLGYDEEDVIGLSPVNNYGLDDELETGNKGYYGQLTFGYPTIRDFGQWNVSGGYRYLESDAVVATFTDSDFHLGGTNTKGFHVGGAFGITRNSWLELQWLSASEVSGAPLAVDVFQLDLNARF
ncbi:putative porin [Steroidobacter flavus]|uniref:Porin n=1 Tax=Steroidobacter flavus TaxID=1842136 RepID=A0ABV8T5R8_9GAMM